MSAAEINSAEKNDRTDFAHRSEQQSFSEKVTNPAARALDVESASPTVQMLRLQLQQARAGSDEEDNPAESAA